MKVLGLLARKGGSGKTTIALHLAVMAQESGLRVLLIDLDPQGSAAAWWRARASNSPQLEPAKPDALSSLIEVAPGGWCEPGRHRHPAKRGS